MCRKKNIQCVFQGGGNQLNLKKSTSSEKVDKTIANKFSTVLPLKSITFFNPLCVLLHSPSSALFVALHIIFCSRCTEHGKKCVYTSFILPHYSPPHRPHTYYYEYIEKEKKSLWSASKCDTCMASSLIAMHFFSFFTTLFFNEMQCEKLWAKKCRWTGFVYRFWTLAWRF